MRHNKYYEPSNIYRSEPGYPVGNIEFGPTLNGEQIKRNMEYNVEINKLRQDIEVLKYQKDQFKQLAKDWKEMYMEMKRIHEEVTRPKNGA